MLGELEASFSCAEDQSARHVEHPEPQRFRFSISEVVVEGEQPQPRGQVRGDRDDLHPRLVDGVLA